MVCHPISWSHRYWKQKITFSWYLECFRYLLTLDNVFFQSFLKPGPFSSYEGSLALGPSSRPVTAASRAPGEEAGKWASCPGLWKLLATGGDLPSFCLEHRLVTRQGGSLPSLCWTGLRSRSRPDAQGKGGWCFLPILQAVEKWTVSKMIKHFCELRLEISFLSFPS